MRSLEKRLETLEARLTAPIPEDRDDGQQQGHRGADEVEIEIVG